MDRYTLHCTKEQTEKAFDLGAPIDGISSSTNEDITTISCFKLDTPIYTDIIKGGFDYALNPTAEQLINWLEEQGLFVSICGYFADGKFTYDIDSKEFIDYRSGLYLSRKEATLAAIDAALDYLSKNRK